MNFEDAINRACEEPTLGDALAYIAIWEFERARVLIVPNQPFETCFKHCIRSVMERYKEH